MILKRTTIIVFVCALAVNCWGKNKPSNSSAEKPAYKVICEDADSCPETVAGLLADGDSVCTSFLVKDDVIATNLHCLPENMRKAGASCKNRIRLTFPERKSAPEEIVECDKVISVSQKAKDTPLTPDFAFLRLAKKMNRAVVKLNTQGVVNNETLTIFKIDPHDEIGVLRKVTCQAAQGSMLNPLFKTAQSSVVTFIPCSIVSGNSGSPFFSADGEVKGILNSTGLPADLPLQDKNFAVAFGSNFSCVNLPQLGLLGNAQDCRESLDRVDIRNASGNLVKESVSPLMPNFRKNVTEQFAKIHAQTKDFLRWTTDQQDIPFTGDEKAAIAKVGFVPKCIDTSRLSLLKMPNTMKLSYEEWGVQLHVDSVGRPTPQLASTPITQTISFSPSDSTKGMVPFRFGEKKFLVPFCSEI